MIQLKRTTSGSISGLEYGQLGVDITDSYARLYVGTSLGNSVPIISDPYLPEGIILNSDSAYIRWSHTESQGYSLNLSSDSLFDVHSKVVRIYSGTYELDQMTGYFGSEVSICNDDASSVMSLGIQGDTLLKGKEISITSTGGPVNIQSSATSPQIRLTTAGGMPEDQTITIQSPYKVLVSAMKFKCDTYPLDDDDVATKKYIDDQCYTAGDVLTFQNMYVYGEITGANKGLYVTFFLDKPIRNVSNATITQGTLIVRQDSKYIFGTSSGGADMLGSVDITSISINNNAMTIRLQYSDSTGTGVAWPNSTNNTAVQTVWLGNAKIQLS